MEALRLVNTAEMPREEWLAWRRKGIGGSDIAAIAGLNPWRSPVAVYLEKIGELPSECDNQAMYWGRKLEDLVAQEFAERNNLKVRRVNAVLQHPKYPMFLANIDREVVGKGRGVLEVKTTSVYNSKEWNDDKLPDHVMVQLQWYLFVTGYKRGYVAALIGGQQYVDYPIERDDTIIEYLQKIALDFWKLVENRTPPEMDGSQSSKEVLDILYPTSTPDSAIELPPTAQDLIAEFEAAQAEEKAAKERKEAAANKLKALLGENEIGWIGDRKVTWKTVTSKRLDTKALKKDMPEVYDKYAKESVSRRFSIK